MRKPKPVKKLPTAGKSIDAFRAAHDKSFTIPRRIREGIAKLGPDGWDYELAFLRMCELATVELAAYRDQFADYLVEIGGRNSKRAWCGSKALAKKLRKMVGPDVDPRRARHAEET